MRTDPSKSASGRLHARCVVGISAAVAAVLIVGQSRHEEDRGPMSLAVGDVGAPRHSAPARDVELPAPRPDAAAPSFAHPEPVAEVTFDTATVPSELANFLKTRSSAYLYQSPGISLPSSGVISGDTKLWRRLAELLEADASSAHEVLMWLSAQRQPDVYVALAAFWGELIRLGILPADAATSGTGQQILIGAIPFQPSLETLGILAGLEVIPSAVLQDFQRRTKNGEIAYSDLIVAALQAIDSGAATTLLALGGVDAPWDAIFTSRYEGHVGQQAAVELAADQADQQVIDRLLARAESINSDLALFMASHWARRQLSGERLAHLEHLVRAGAFHGGGHRLLATLLANAEDREGAGVLAQRLGIAIPPAPPR